MVLSASPSRAKQPNRPRQQEKAAPASAAAQFLGASGADKVAPLVAVHVNIMIYAFCFWLTRPVEPFLQETLGGDVKSFGLLQSWFSFLMLVGGPVVGRTCDTKGAHVGVMMTQTGAGLSYLFTGLASTLQMLFLARVPTLLLHTMMASQAVVTHLTGEDTRAVAMGRLSLSYGIGMTLGSSLGGKLATQIGYSEVALVAAAASFLSLPLTYLAVPTALMKPDAAKAAMAATTTKKEGAEKEGLDLGKVLELLKTPAVRTLIITHTVLSMGLGLHRSTSSTVLKEVFAFGPEELGFVMTLSGVVGLVSNVFLIAPVTKFFAGDELATVSAAAFVAALSSAGLALTPAGKVNVNRVYALLVPMGMASTVMYTVFASLYTKSCDKRDAGTCLSLQHGVGTFLGIFLPTTGAYMFANLGFQSIGFTSGSLLLFSALMIRSKGAAKSE